MAWRTGAAGTVKEEQTYDRIRKVQELEIVRTKEFGVYLSEKAGDEAAVLLPKKQVPQGAQIGDKVEVLYTRIPRIA